jgi:hypothetical protein
VAQEGEGLTSCPSPCPRTRERSFSVTFRLTIADLRKRPMTYPPNPSFPTLEGIRKPLLYPLSCGD